MLKKKFSLASSLAFYLLTAFGISLTISAGVGVSSFNSLNLSLAYLSHLKIGTVTILVNGSFLFAYICLTNFKLKKTYLRQLIALLAFGQVINFFSYQILGNFTLSSYPLKLSIFILGLALAGFGTGMVLNLQVLTFPIEGVCLILAEKTAFTFKQLRYSIDLFSVAFSLLVTLMTSAPLVVREGTFLSLFLLSFFISQTKLSFDQKKLLKAKA